MPSVNVVNGKDLRQGLVEYGEWVFLGTQVGVSGATTSAIPDATRLKGLALPSTLFNNCTVRIVSGQNAGERTYVDYLDPNAGILYVSPALSNVMADGDEYEIWRRGIDPDIVDRLRDDCLQKFCSQWRVVPVSMVLDGDLEEPVEYQSISISSSTDASPIAVTCASAHSLVTGAQVSIVGHQTNIAANGVWTVTVTSTTAFTLDGSSGSGAGAGAGGFAVVPKTPGAWTIGGSALAQKLFSSFPHAHSRHTMVVAHPTAATDYLDSALVDVTPGDVWFVEVLAQAYVTATPASPGSAGLVIIDVTNTDTISLSGGTSTATGKGPQVISGKFTIPDGCYQIRLRLTCDTNNSTTRWSSFALYTTGLYSFSLPPRITAKKRVGNFYTVSQTTDGNPSRQLKNSPFQSIERVQVGAQVEVYVNPQTNTLPMYFYERGYSSRLETGYFTTAQRILGDGALTDAHKEYVIAALATRLAKYMLDKVGEEWQDDWIRASADFNYWEGQHGPEPKMIHEVESPVYIPQLET